MVRKHALISAIVGLSTSTGVAARSYNGQVACTAAAISQPYLFGAEIQSLTVEEVRNRTVSSNDNAFPSNLTVSYCGVNISYTHTGWNDLINVEVWLPLDTWNGRFQGTGGGGWQMSSGAPALASAVGEGYSAARTDGGHPDATASVASASNWALLSPGNINFPLLQDFAAVALSDMAILGKSITKSYYGQQPEYSYWTGCSTGGRQGMMLAQRYPDLYDGILAKAPAINWDSFVVTEYWPQQVMNTLGVYPPPCEIEAFTQAAVAACDELDGLKDGVISDANACAFDPYSIVGKSFSCNGTDKSIFTREGAAVVEAAWVGPVDASGKKEWYGLNKDASLAGIANTVVAGGNSSARGAPFAISAEYIKYFLTRDPAFDLRNITGEDFFRLLHHSRNQFSSIIGTADPDLSLFKSHGGKIITWHGLADELIFLNGTEDYYKRVMAEVADVQDFYRIFEAPGVGHCSGGAGPQPRDDLKALVEWVENGVAPDTLPVVNTTLNGAEPGPGGELPRRKICAWPKKQRYNGGGPLVADSFDCV